MTDEAEHNLFPCAKRCRETGLMPRVYEMKLQFLELSKTTKV
jgi:hypothetical protein